MVTNNRLKYYLLLTNLHFSKYRVNIFPVTQSVVESPKIFETKFIWGNTIFLKEKLMKLFANGLQH